MIKKREVFYPPIDLSRCIQIQRLGLSTTSRLIGSGQKTEMVPDQTGTKDFSDKCCISTHGCWKWCNLFFLWKNNEMLFSIFFWDVNMYVKRFWEQLQTVVNNACANSLFVNLNENIVLLGHDCNFKSDNTFDLIILLTKFFIYKCKVKKNIPQFHLFKNYLKTVFEAYISQ